MNREEQLIQQTDNWEEAKLRAWLESIERWRLEHLHFPDQEENLRRTRTEWRN